MLEEVQARSAGPSSIAIYPTSPQAAPDIAAWQSKLGIALRMAGTWDWRTVPAGAGVSLAQERQRWSAFTGAAARLRPAAWIVGAVLDPALQMRRNLAEARHAAGQSDNGDFLPMIEKVMAGMKDLPEGGLRVL